jgi:hypothetical protein
MLFAESIISNLRHPFTLSISEAPTKTTEPSSRKSTGSPETGLEISLVDASSRYKFANNHGENVAIMYAGKRAKRVE